MAEYYPTDAEQEAIRVINSEKASWEDGTVSVTNKTVYNTTKIVKKARNNFLGVYNNPKDTVTGRDKLFVPFTEWTTENMLKNIDIDTKDINVLSKHPDAMFAAQVYRYILKSELDRIQFGKTMNRLLRWTAIDGTGFLKAEEMKGKLVVSLVDRLNMIYDPTAETLDESSGIIERHVLEKPAFDELDLDNSQYVKGQTEVGRIGFNFSITQDRKTEIPYVELFERYGYLPKWVVEGTDPTEDTEYVYSRTLISNLDGSPIVHLIEEVDGHPYGAFKLKEVQNRMDGRGIPEMLFNIQAYLNEVINIRMNRARISQLGLFKLTGNVTPQDFKRMFSTSAIKLDGNSDVELLNTGGSDPGSYNDEETAYKWGQRVTGTTAEDEIASSKPATNALIEQQGSSKGYNLRMEDLFFELGQFIEKKMVPIINKNIKKGELVRITGDVRIMDEITRKFAENLVYSRIGTSINILDVTDEDIDAMVEEMVNTLSEQGEHRIVPAVKGLFDFDYNIAVVLGDEQINRATMVQQLTQVMGILTSAGMDAIPVLKEVIDLMGMDSERLVKEIKPAPQQEGGEVPPTEEVPGTMPGQVPKPGQQTPVTA